jgi:hypothetical protein
MAKESALHPPYNAEPVPQTTPPAYTPGDPSLCSLCDVNCCTSCCGEAKGAYAGVGFYYVQPFWSNNPALYHFATSADNAEVLQANQHDFRHDYELAPLVWVGVRCGDGFGLRGRWWQYDQSAGESVIDDLDDYFVGSASPLGLRIRDTTVDNAAAPETVETQSDLRLTVFDLEATQDLQCLGWWVTVSGGARYAYLTQSYGAARLEADREVLDILLSGHSFKGIGPTAALEARRPLMMGLGVYGGSRAALLYGHAKQAAHLRPQTDQLPNRDASYSHETLRPVLEIEVGFEWRGRVGCAELFFQAGLVGQSWFDAGNASRSSAPSTGSAPIRSGGDITDADLGFFGITMALGARY